MTTIFSFSPATIITLQAVANDGAIKAAIVAVLQDVQAFGTTPSHKTLATMIEPLVLSLSTAKSISTLILNAKKNNVDLSLVNNYTIDMLRVATGTAVGRAPNDAQLEAIAAHFPTAVETFKTSQAEKAETKQVNAETAKSEKAQQEARRQALENKLTLNGIVVDALMLADNADLVAQLQAMIQEAKAVQAQQAQQAQQAAQQAKAQQVAALKAQLAQLENDAAAVVVDLIKPEASPIVKAQVIQRVIKPAKRAEKVA